MCDLFIVGKEDLLSALDGFVEVQVGLCESARLHQLFRPEVEKSNEEQDKVG